MVWLLVVGLVGAGFFGVRLTQTHAQSTSVTISNLKVASSTPTSATVTWNTNVPTDGTITWAFGGCGLFPAQFATGLVTTHSITVSGLSSGCGTPYSILVTSNPATGTGASQSLNITLPTVVTAPSSGSGKTDITSVNIVALTANQAQISFSYSSGTSSSLLSYDVHYGETTAYDSVLPASPLTAASALFSLPNLKASATYHFSIQIYASGVPDPVAVSADRTFTTPTAGGDASPLIIERIRTDCIDRSCQVYFSTTRAATVEVRWAGSAQSSFGAYPDGLSEAGFSSAFRALRFPDIGGGQTPLTKNTQYHYRLQASMRTCSEDRTKSCNVVGDCSGTCDLTRQFTTGDLTFTTSNSPADHTFGTGECVDTVTGTHVTIGTCFNKQFCTTDATLVDDCTKCGLICATGNTCRTTASGGRCEADPVLKPDAPSQCNVSTCYTDNGAFKSPAVGGCYASWPRCNANTILKVRKDRGCNLWLTCATSYQTPATSNSPAQNICLSLAACNGLNSKGQCSHYLPPGQCNNDPLRFCNSDLDCQEGGTCNLPMNENPTRNLQDLTFRTPEQIEKIANLSGNVIAGLDWHNQGGSTVIQGMLPWQLMRQVGAKGIIQNGDFEYYQPPRTTGFNIVPTPDSGTATMSVNWENVDDNVNHVLKFTPVVERTYRQCSTKKDADGNPQLCTEASLDCDVGDTCDTVTVAVNYSGVATDAFDVSPNEYYFAEARVKVVGSSTPKLRAQFGYDNYTKFQATTTVKLCKLHPTQTCNIDADCPSGDSCSLPQKVTINTFADFNADSTWQRVTIGPIRGMVNNARFAIVCADNSTCGDNPTILVDDVQVRPVLQVNTNPLYIAPSCRLYPKEDSPSCDYVDANGVAYKGWRGYCLERDSQTGTCLSWWPVDLIKGESDIFGTEQTVGYQDRAPLYLCAEAAGINYGGPFSTYPYTISTKYNTENANCNIAGNNCVGSFSSDYTIAACSTSGSPNCIVNATGNESKITEEEISKVEWVYTGGFADQVIAPIIFPNNNSFHNSTAGSPYEKGSSDNEDRVLWAIYRDTTSSSQYIFWRLQNTRCDGGGLNGNCITAIMAFDKNTHFFKYYLLDVNDQTGNESEIIPYQIVFYVKESCQTLVQVVSPSGDNQAFAGRINSSSYSVPDLGYTKTTDLTPYGGALSPSNQENDPTRWPVLPIEKADVVNFTSPGQARGGSPYACNGPCNQLICTTDPNNHCANSTDINNCQTHVDANGNVGGECTGVSATAASEKGPQTLTYASPIDSNSYFSLNRMMRLFAQSYGIWTANRCSNNANKSCLANSDCVAPGTCSDLAGTYLAMPNSVPPITSGSFVGWTPPTKICTPQQQPGVCSTSAAQCPLSTTGQVTGVSPTCLSGCDQNALNQEAMNNGIATCKNTAACDGTTTACPGSGTTTKFTGGSGNPADCQTVPASFPAVGVTQQCTVTCTLNAAASYQQTSVIQTPQIRPTRGNFPNDYCAVPPSIFCPGKCETGQLAAFFGSSGTTKVISGGSGNVSIQFGSRANDDQLPLANIRIDWGDETRSYPFPYAPHTNPKNPHVFNHIYILNRGDTDHCSVVDGRTHCTYEIKVQVEDNWGWCNDYEVRPSQPTDIPCHQDILPDGIHYNSKQWQTVGLKVTIEP